MDTRFVDRELVALERLRRIADEREIELPPELAVEIGEESFGWTEDRVIACLEQRLAQRLAEPNRPRRTELLPPRNTAQRVSRRRLDCEEDCQCVLCHTVDKDPGERIHTTGRVSSIKAHRADERQANRQAAEARRKANGGR